MTGDGPHVDRLLAKFNPPSLVRTGKRGRRSIDDRESVAAQGSNDSNSSKRAMMGTGAAPFIGSKRLNMGSGQDMVDSRSSSGDEDDEEREPMSISQLDRHARRLSSSSGSATATMITIEQTPEKTVFASIERKAMASRAAQHKRERALVPLTQASPSPFAGSGQSSASGSRYILCMWRNHQARKHKTWEGDACLIIAGGIAKLIDKNSKQCLANNFKVRQVLESGDILQIGGTKEIEIDREISQQEYTTGVEDKARFARSTAVSAVSAVSPAPIQTGRTPRTFQAPSLIPVRSTKVEGSSNTKESAPPTAPVAVPAQSFYAKLSENGEKRKEISRSKAKSDSGSTMLHPQQGSAFVMKRPDAAHQKENKKDASAVIDVAINPILTSILRLHQIEGIRFLYERIMRMRVSEEDDHPSAILADDMGLGKTLQTIAVIDMLLNQSCYKGRSRTVDRALIVCPVSVVKNWKREFRKWLGGKIKVQVIDDTTKIESTIQGNFQVLIMGYEKLLTCHKQIQGVQPRFGLLVCDEAHRLKNLSAKTSRMLAEFDVDPRILLTGTPIQNNLQEFHAMVDLAAPNLLGDLKLFKKVFEDPIVRSRIPTCSEQQRQLGKERSDALRSISGGLILRRSSDILLGYLPPRYDQVIFCSPTKEQIALYEKLLQSDPASEIRSGRTSSASVALPFIGLLRKLCNSPELLINTAGSDAAGHLRGIKGLLPSKVENLPELSGKLMCVFKMLDTIKKHTDDKIVLASNFTSTLDILEDICRRKRFHFFRLDGKTKQEDRNSYVNQFNRADNTTHFIFLLSTKAGGTGINLIGANRLILFDSDWNPASDKQAMARVHRDGQTKPCYIYRLLLPGMMDEKMYQRQISKIGLSDSFMDEMGNFGSHEVFSPEELRAIFQLRLDTPCQSHDQIRCPCRGNGIPGAGRSLLQDPRSIKEEDAASRQPAAPSMCFVSASQVLASQADAHQHEDADVQWKMAALLQWAHHDCRSKEMAPTEDSIINEIVAEQHHKQLTSDGSDCTGEGEFDMKKIKPGCILYTYAKSSKSTAEENT